MLAETNVESWLPLLLRSIVRGRAALLPQGLAIGRHLGAALAWIEAAHAHATDGGIPAYFDLLRDRWTRSYPETTGYTVPTLLAAAQCLGRPELRALALALADYVLRARTPEGGVANWREDGATGTPMVFDSGQAIFGWLAAWGASGETVYLDAATTAGDWLAGVQDASGAWLRGQYLDTVKVIDTRVAWALVCLAGVGGRDGYRQAARRNLEWALSRQRPDGWFAQAAFRAGDDPYTHTIVYTAEGLLEAGLLLGEPRYVAAAERTARALLERQRPDGGLASTYAEGWRATSRASCLSGDCQAALLWLRLHGLAGDERYLEAARRAVAFVAGTQDLAARHPGVRGGIAGSYPISGRYERLKYPNWAAKFFVDALLALDGAPVGDKYAG